MTSAASKNFRSLLQDAFHSRSCRKLTLSRAMPNAHGADRVTVRLLIVRDEPCYQFAFRVGTQERHENLSPQAAAQRADNLFGSAFLEANLFTDEADYAARCDDRGNIRVRRNSATKAAAAPQTHDRTKQRLIPEGVPCPFLIEIGVMTPSGKVRADKQHKFRQINRFLEFIEEIVPALPAQGTLRIVDFGCGKSALTFAVHHLLTVVHGRGVEIHGLDRNPSVVATCRDVAARLHCEGLEFHTADISQHSESGPVHLALSLHACDTATDFMLAKAISWKAEVILAVPCCQHEVAEQLEQPILAPLLRHGILRERFAALATDALRAEWLEASGYRTQVVEFIDLEHTPKNLLLRAVRRAEPAPQLLAAHRASAEQFADFLGIQRLTIASWLSRSVAAPDSDLRD